MNRATPTELRQSLEAANTFIRNGIPFICVPYTSNTERNALIEMSQKALEQAANHQQQQEGGE